MNGLMMHWSLSSEVLQWFVTTLFQVTLLAGLALLASRFMPQHAVLRHSLLTSTLLLIVIAPWSTWCLQRAGYGVIEITAHANPSADENSELPTELIRPNELDARPSSEGASESKIGSADPRMRLGERTMQEGLMQESNKPQLAQFPSTGVTTSPDQNESISDANQSRATPSLLVQDLLEFAVSSQLWRNLLSCICVFWLIGCIVMAIRWLVAWMRLSRLIARSNRVKVADTEAAYLAACRLVRCDPHTARVVISTAIATPVVAGILKPTIVIPESLNLRVSRQQLVEIFVHELAHVMRRDQLVLVVQQVARLLFWAHPLVERLCQRVTRASEEICDNYVLIQSENTAYSHTLLAVAELTAGQQNPLGTIGVVGGSWSLTERVAGLLDNRRERKTRLNGRSLMAVAVMAFCFSIVLLLTFRFTTEIASAQPPVVPDQANHDDATEGLRGAGDQLEFRLRGRLLSDDGTQLVNPTVSLRDATSSNDYPATVVGDRYEVWLPANSFKWFQITLSAKCNDGRRGGRAIASNQLRKAIIEGVDIELRRASRSIKVLVKHDGQLVPNAKLRVQTMGTTGPNEMFVETDSRGEATIEIITPEVLSSITAWTDSGMLGGYQFGPEPKRDPGANEHVVELIEGQERTVHVVAPDGSTVEGLRLMLRVASPPPHINYFGNPTDCEVVTDSTGTAIYRWFPDVEHAHHYAELIDENEWKLKSQRNTEEAVEIVVARPAARVRIEGQVSRGGQYVGGVLVKAQSFQGESETKTELRFAIADREGKFSFDALADSTYCLIVVDDQWVSEPSIFTPVDPVNGQKVSPHLTALDGTPVTIHLTSGPYHEPMAGQEVVLNSEIWYSWYEKGKRQNGVTARGVHVTTDEQGLATGLVPQGNLLASVFTAAGQVHSKFFVADKGNRIEMHRFNHTAKNATAKEVTGRIKAPRLSDADLKKISVSIMSLDGETSDELTPSVDGSGQFHFQTKATAVGCFARTEDGALSAAVFIDDLTQPFDVKLVPTAYLSGQILDSEGRPVVDHAVFAKPMLSNPSFFLNSAGRSMTKDGQTVKSKTDENGNYRLGPLPRLTSINLSCDPLENGVEFSREYLGKYYIKLDKEQRQPQVHRISKVPKASTK